MALKKLTGDLGAGLLKALKDINTEELIRIENWDNALEIAFYDMPIRTMFADILESWYPNIRKNIKFTDFVLFKIVKYFPEENEQRKKWISECVKIAIEKKSFSLVESLILILQKDACNIPELFELAKDFAKSSDQMKRVLLNACNYKNN